MSEDKNRLPTERHSAEVADFLDKLKRAPVAHTGGGRGRLIFALDATASREPTWDRACRIQGEMFEATAARSAGSRSSSSITAAFRNARRAGG